MKGKAMQVTYPALTEIDIATAPAFLVAMREAIDWADNRAVVIDCSAITFMDSGAFHALMHAHDYAIAHDHILVLRDVAKNCRRLVSICDPSGVLTFET
jgi:anti-anti-sigma factor